MATTRRGLFTALVYLSMYRAADRYRPVQDCVTLPRTEDDFECDAVARADAALASTSGLFFLFFVDRNRIKIFRLKNLAAI